MNINGNSSDNSFTGIVDIEGNLDVSEDITCKNLNVSDTITAHTIVTEQQLEVKDPLILCGKDNPADALNLGMIEEHNNGAADRWTGFVRSKDDKRHYLLNNYTPKPTPTDDIRPLGGLRGLLGDMVLNQLNCETLDSDTSLRCETGIVMAQNSTPWVIDPTKPSADGQILAYNQGTNSTEWISNSSSVNSKTLSTGVFDGGVLSVNADDTKYDISDGSGQIVDPTTGTINPVSWTGLTAQITTYTGILTFVSINISGVPVYSTTHPSNSSIRDNIFLGVLVHVNSVNIDVVNNEQMPLLSSTNQIHDLARAIGFISTSGNTIGPSGVNLTFLKSLGTMFAYGSNYFNDVKNPHEISTPLVDTNAGGIFQYRYQDGTSGPLTDTLLKPGEYDDGNGQGAPGSVSSNDWQVQRVYLFVSNNVKIQPGQATYNTKTEALNGIQTEDFTTEPSIDSNGLLIGYIVVRGGASDLNLAGDAQFIQASKFGASGGGGAVVVNLQNAYDSSSSPQITTDATNPIFTIQQDPGVANGSFLNVLNLAGTNRLNCKDDTLLVSNLTVGGAGAEYYLPTSKGADGYGLGIVNPISSPAAVGWIKYTEGATSSTNTAIVRWDGTLGSKVQNSAWTISNLGVLSDGNFSAQGGAISGTNSTMEEFRLKDGIGTEQFYFKLNGTTLELTDAVSNVIQTIDQVGNTVWYNDVGTKLMQIDSDGKFGITSKVALNETFELHKDGNASMVIGEHTAALSGPAIKFECSQGTELSPLAVLTSQPLGGLYAYGYDSVNYDSFSGVFNFVAEENFTNSSKGCSFNIGTASIGTTSVITRLGVSGSGVIQFNNNAYRFPTTAGTDGEVLRTNGSGTLTWQQLTPASTTDNTLPRFNGTTGLLQSSGWAISDVNDLTNVGGKIGIGTSTPGSLLEIKDGATQVLDVDDTSGISIGVDLRYETPLAEMYVIANATTTTATNSNTWYKVNFASGQTTSGQAIDFTIDTTTNIGRITYDETRTRLCHVIATICLKSDTNANLTEMCLFKNTVATGSQIVASHIKFDYSFGVATYHNVNLQCLVSLASTDTLELAVKSTNTGSVVYTIENCTITAIAQTNV